VLPSPEVTPIAMINMAVLFYMSFGRLSLFDNDKREFVSQNGVLYDRKRPP
jgi:hypothetical protein